MKATVFDPIYSTPREISRFPTTTTTTAIFKPLSSS